MYIESFTPAILPVLATVFAILANCHSGAPRRHVCDQRCDCAQLCYLPSAGEYRFLFNVYVAIFFFLLSHYNQE